MITKDKTNLKTKTTPVVEHSSLRGKKSKILVLGLILLVILPVGLFSFAPEAEAQQGSFCVGEEPTGTGGSRPYYRPAGSSGDCKTGETFQTLAPPATSGSSNKGKTDLEKALDSCGFFGEDSSIQGCIQLFFYFLFVTIPSLLLAFTANFFNFMAGLTLSSDFYASDFIEKIWIVIRDFANIFFILVLLYAAFQIILDIGHGGGKKIIASVILMALLVNFSLFFTKVVIDASNVVALIFYNRIETKDGGEYESVGAVRGIPEKNMAGQLVGAFNVNKFFDEEFLEKLKQPDKRFFGLIQVNKVPTGMLIGIMVVYGLVIYALCYAFLIAGLSFLGRMLTLMMLMMVSPLAFVSLAVPGLKGVETIGFDSWIKNLIKTAFVAAIFIFIIYIISVILDADVFDSNAATSNPSERGPIAFLILTFVPALMIAMLLIKGAGYAKKASGEFSGAVISGAKVVGSLALGGAALGTAVVGRSTVGAFMKGASTGDTAARRMQGADVRIARHRTTINDPNSNIVQRMQARKEIARERKDQIKGTIQQGLGIHGAQTWVGQRLNQDQRNVEQAAHARHELDEVANAVSPGKKWDDLNGEKRLEARRKMERDRVVRDNAGAGAVAGDHNYVAGLGGLGTRKWDALTGAERNLIDALIGAQVGGPNAGQAVAGGRLALNETHADEHTIPEARVKQGTISNVIQSTVTGGYDVRKLADVVAKEQSTGIAKLTAGLTGALASGLRGGFKQMGVNYGTPQGAFFKDLGNTITEALKSAKINVDLSHVGEEKKEGGKGGGHH